MVSVEDPEKIKASLDLFIHNTQSPASSLPANGDGPLVMLYGQTKLGVPQNHPSLREIEANRKEPAVFKECEVLLRGVLKNRVIFRASIHKSNLSNCILVSCTIYGGKIESCHLSDCRIQKETFGVDGVSAMTPFISCCQIQEGAAYDAEIFNSGLKGVSPVQGCDVENCLVDSSVGRHSTLTSCGVSESELRNCEVYGGVLTQSAVETKTSSNLRVLPVEIRKAIFENVIAGGGASAGLIAALRPDPLLYAEILETLFREHIFVLSSGNRDALRYTSLTVLQRITKIYLGGKDLISTSNVAVYFPSNTKIADLQMEFQGSRVNVQHFYNVTKLWFKYFGTVRKFTVIWSQFWKPWNFRTIRVAPEPPESLSGAIKVANKWLKTEATLVRRTGQVKKQEIPAFSGGGMFNNSDATEFQDLETYAWTWKAEEGSVLAWRSS